MTDTPNENDISADAVERHTELMLRYNLIDAVKCMDALAVERDALQAKLDEAVNQLYSTRHSVAVLEGRLHEAMGALVEISTEQRLDHIHGGLCLTDGAIEARATLAKLKGETDE